MRTVQLQHVKGPPEKGEVFFSLFLKKNTSHPRCRGPAESSALGTRGGLGTHDLLVRGPVRPGLPNADIYESACTRLPKKKL